MANRAGTIAAGLIGAALAALTLGSAAVTAGHATEWSLAPSDGAALRFTLTQAALSALLSGLFAVPVARALARRVFPGRIALIHLMAAPFLLPVVVAVLGILAVFGRQGPVNQTLAALGLEPISIFGLHGVVMANVFLNLPLTARMLLQGWQAIPAERFRLAQSLGMGPLAQFRHLELPMLRSVLPGAVATVFLLCLTSFAVALTLGGGPGASTVELSIYQALRFEFDLGRAASLAFLQFGLCLSVTLISLRLTRDGGFGPGLGRQNGVPAPHGWRRWADAVAIVLAALFLLAPLAAVLLRGLPALAALPDAVGPAALRSVTVAVGSALLAAVSALVLAQTAARGAHWLEPFAMLPLAASGLVMGTGLFLALRPFVAAETVTLPVTLLVNACLSLPYLFRLLLPAARRVEADHARLCSALNMTGWLRLRLVTLPYLARPLGFGTGLAAALSMGDLGVIALFAGDRGATLPLVVQRLIGAYRMEAAAGAALVLVALSFAIFVVFDRLGARHAAT